MITVKVDNASALAGLNKINPAQIRSRLQGAVQRTLTQARAEATARVNARFTRDYATPVMKVTASGLRGKLSAKDRRHSLATFLHKPASRPPHKPPGGITAYVRRGVAENYSHAFIGRGQIFERVGRSRLPLKRHLGAGGANELGSRHVAPQVERLIGQRIEQELERAITL